MKEYFWDISRITEEEFRKRYYEMPEERRLKCKRILRPLEKKQCIAAYGLAKNALSDYLNLPETEIKISFSPDGKPFLEGNPAYFSLSHSETAVICVVSSLPIGIDIEKIRLLSGSGIDRICTADEAKWLREASTPEEKSERFLFLWTRKEALFKAKGSLPRRDNQTDVIHGNEDWIIQTRKQGEYFISIAERKINA